MNESHDEVPASDGAAVQAHHPSQCFESDTFDTCFAIFMGRTEINGFAYRLLNRRLLPLHSQCGGWVVGRIVGASRGNVSCSVRRLVDSHERSCFP